MSGSLRQLFNLGMRLGAALAFGLLAAFFACDSWAGPKTDGANALIAAAIRATATGAGLKIVDILQCLL